MPNDRALRLDWIGRYRHPVRWIESDGERCIVQPPALQPDANLPATLIGTEQEKRHVRIVLGRVHRLRQRANHHVTVDQ